MAVDDQNPECERGIGSQQIGFNSTGGRSAQFVEQHRLVRFVFSLRLGGKVLGFYRQGMERKIPTIYSWAGIFCVVSIGLSSRYDTDNILLNQVGAELVASHGRGR